MRVCRNDDNAGRCAASLNLAEWKYRELFDAYDSYKCIYHRYAKYYCRNTLHYSSEVILGHRTVLNKLTIPRPCGWTILGFWILVYNSVTNG